MRIAIISDIHGNIAALEAVLADVKNQNVKTTYCLGDLVGYAPFPTRSSTGFSATRFPRSWGTTTMASGSIATNVDAHIAIPRSSGWETSRSSGPRRPSRRTESRSFDRNRLPSASKPDLGLELHGSPGRMNEYLFEDRPLSSFQRLAAASETDVLVFGHTHRPYTKRVEDVLFINVGSVGKPKDGDPRACYVVLDTSGDVDVEFRRVPYDIEAVASAIRRSELPDKFAADLETG